MKTYFVQKRHSRVIKIGQSKNVKGRIAQLQVSCEEQLVLLLETSAVTEKEMHDRFAADRLASEWFQPDAIVAALAEIAAMPEPMDEADEVAAPEPIDEVGEAMEVFLRRIVAKAITQRDTLIEYAFAYEGDDNIKALGAKRLLRIFENSKEWGVDPGTAFNRMLREASLRYVQEINATHLP